MAAMPKDPIVETGGITALGRAYRSGATTVLEAVDAYLERIERMNQHLQAFETVDPDGARAQARAIDAMLSRGVDPGPLAGVPVAVKDIIAVDGLPTHHGSRLDVSDLVSREGSSVRRLRATGAIILGKTKTVEFAFGATGLSRTRGMPHNPWDLGTPRLTGGSSSGSAVAMAAGLCAFAIGSDTGASVRLPAALNGVAGQKTTVGLWPTDGVFPLSPTFDSIGTFARDLDDLTLVFHAIEATKPIAPLPLDGLRLGIPRSYFFDDLSEDVGRAMEALLSNLRDAGCRLVPVDLEGTAERREIFRDIVSSEVLSALGPDRFEAARAEMDRTVAGRIAAARDVGGWQYLRAKRRQQALEGSVREAIAHVDAIVTPVNIRTALAAADLGDPEVESEVAIAITRCTQPMNIYNLCGATLPIQHLVSGRLPVGAQVMSAAGSDRRMLAITRAIETSIGIGPAPDLSTFASP